MSARCTDTFLSHAVSMHIINTCEVYLSTYFLVKKLRGPSASDVLSPPQKHGLFRSCLAAIVLDIVESQEGRVEEREKRGKFSLTCFLGKGELTFLGRGGRTDMFWEEGGGEN